MRKSRKTFPPVAPLIALLLDENVGDPEEFIRVVRESDLPVTTVIALANEANRDPLAVARELAS